MVTQIIRGQTVTTMSNAGNLVQNSTQKMVTAPSTPMQPIQSRPATPQGQQPIQRPQQGQVRLTMAQLTQLTQGQVRNVMFPAGIEESHSRGMLPHRVSEMSFNSNP